MKKYHGTKEITLDRIINSKYVELRIFTSGKDEEERNNTIGMFAYRIDYIDGVVSLCLQDTSSKSAQKNDKLSLALFRRFKELYPDNPFYQITDENNTDIFKLLADGFAKFNNDPDHALLMEEWRRYRLALEIDEYLHDKYPEKMYKKVVKMINELQTFDVIGKMAYDTLKLLARFTYISNISSVDNTD